MPQFVEFNSFIESTFEGVHNLASDTLKLMLTNDAPSVTDSEVTDINEIDTGNGYVAGGPTIPVVTSFQQSGTYNLALANVTILAAGGEIGPFQYAVVYNESAASNHLIGYYDAGEELVIDDTKEFLLAFQDLFLTAKYGSVD